MVDLDLYRKTQNIVGFLLILEQIFGLISLWLSRFLGKRIEQKKIINNIDKKRKIIQILFYIGLALVGLSFLSFLFLFINKNIYDFFG